MGLEGVGKTWATIDWLTDTKPEQPIILTIPSSATVGRLIVSDVGLKRFVAERLHLLTDVRDPDHWQIRLDRLLKRPRDEGPVLTLVFDGINQEPRSCG